MDTDITFVDTGALVEELKRRCKGCVIVIEKEGINNNGYTIAYSGGAATARGLLQIADDTIKGEIKDGKKERTTPR